jgi:hypothetical protein
LLSSLKGRSRRPLGSSVLAPLCRVLVGSRPQCSPQCAAQRGYASPSLGTRRTLGSVCGSLSTFFTHRTTCIAWSRRGAHRPRRRAGRRRVRCASVMSACCQRAGLCSVRTAAGSTSHLVRLAQLQLDPGSSDSWHIYLGSGRASAAQSQKRRWPAAWAQYLSTQIVQFLLERRGRTHCCPVCETAEGFACSVMILCAA